MTQNDIDCFNIAQKILDTQEDFRPSLPKYLSHKIQYNPHGLPWLSFEKHSFVVDWQLTVSENSDADILWY